MNSSSSPSPPFSFSALHIAHAEHGGITPESGQFRFAAMPARSRRRPLTITPSQVPGRALLAAMLLPSSCPHLLIANHHRDRPAITASIPSSLSFHFLPLSLALSLPLSPELLSPRLYLFFSIFLPCPAENGFFPFRFMVSLSL